MPTNPLHRYLESDDTAVEAQWTLLERWVEQRFGRAAGIEGVLFLVGIQSRGRGYEPDLEKEVKQALIMEGTYAVFETLGIYERVGMEEDGSWIWERVIDHPPGLSVEQQEKLLRIAILRYFSDVVEDLDACDA